MDDQKAAMFRKIIEDRIEEIEADIIKMKEQTKPIEPDNAIGRLSRMEAINARGVSEKALNGLETRLVKLKATLKKVDTSDYGYCQECGDEISEGRLKLVPESIRCVSCMK